MARRRSLIHGLRYVFPGVLKGESRGVPTAWAAQPLADLIADAPNELPPVWPDARGRVRGLALEPVHASVVQAADRLQASGCARLVSIELLELGAAALGDLVSEVVIVGGASIQLWITDPVQRANAS